MHTMTSPSVFLFLLITDLPHSTLFNTIDRYILDGYAYSTYHLGRSCSLRLLISARGSVYTRPSSYIASLIDVEPPSLSPSGAPLHSTSLLVSALTLSLSQSDVTMTAVSWVMHDEYYD